MKWVLRGMSLAVGLLVVGLTALGASSMLGLKVPFQTQTTDRSQPTLLKSIEGLSEYHAAVGNFEVILDVQQDVDWVPDFVAGERSLFVAGGTVDAYVDFAGLADSDLILSEDGRTVMIRLPEPELDKPNLDQKRTYLFSQARGVLNRLNDALSTNDQQKMYTLAEQKLSEAAKESDLKRQAAENTRAMLVGMCNALGIQATFIEVPKPSPTQ